MTIHYHKPNYQCPRCTQVFLPYKLNIECPNCGMQIDNEDVEEYLDVVESIAGSMRMHKWRYGNYHPGVWYTGNIMDHIQGIIYQIFDAMEKVKPKNEEEYLKELLENKFDWGEQQYLCKHIQDITAEIFKIYKTKNLSEIEYSPPAQPTRSERIKNWFRKYLP